MYETHGQGETFENDNMIISQSFGQKSENIYFTSGLLIFVMYSKTTTTVFVGGY